MIIKNLKFILPLFLALVWTSLAMTSCKNSSTTEEMEEVKAEITNATEEAQKELKDMTENVQSEIDETLNSKAYNITQVDSAPLFDASCKDKANPSKCSEEKLFAFIKKNAKFPKRAQTNGASSLEQVLLVIEADGSLSNAKYVASSNQKTCTGCQQAAVDVVGMMDNWVPAMKDGKPVAVKMTIPIKFEG